MSPLDRRGFLRHASALGAGSLIAPALAALTPWSGFTAAQAARMRSRQEVGFGPLAPSPDCPELHIPAGFRVVAISRTRQPSLADPSFTVPNALDGMGAFPLPNGNVLLIRNHEIRDTAARAQPLGPRPYDPRAGGGTTSIEVEIRPTDNGFDLRVVREFVSLSGTHVNCAGGRTPWGSWLSCEETTAGPSQGYERPHGYIFEVPVDATEPVEPVPYKAMGRFVHEAAAVDPRTGIVYETEDVRWSPGNPEEPGAGFYRFLPNEPGRLAAGGRLQMLAIRGRPRYNTAVDQRVGEALPVTWIDIVQPDPPEAETDPSAVFRAGHARGGAIFQRVEGCFWADDSCYFVATAGGNARAGQIWRFIPEGDGGQLVLVFESPSPEVLDYPDNVCTTPRGGLILCEDGDGDQFVRGLTRESVVVDIVRQPVAENQPASTEFCGACFAPDYGVLFFNIQGGRVARSTVPGATYALWGPWERGGL